MGASRARFVIAADVLFIFAGKMPKCRLKWWRNGSVNSVLGPMAFGHAAYLVRENPLQSIAPILDVG